MPPGDGGPLSTASDVSVQQQHTQQLAPPATDQQQGLSRGSAGPVTGAGGSGGSTGSGGVNDAGLSVVFEDLSDVRPSRKGVYVQVGLGAWRIICPS
jgi:hypothetical protein